MFLFLIRARNRAGSIGSRTQSSGTHFQELIANMLSLWFLRQFQAFLWNGQVSSYRGWGFPGSRTHRPLKRLQGGGPARSFGWGLGEVRRDEWRNRRVRARNTMSGRSGDGSFGSISDPPPSTAFSYRWLITDAGRRRRRRRGREREQAEEMNQQVPESSDSNRSGLLYTITHRPGLIMLHFTYPFVFFQFYPNWISMDPWERYPPTSKDQTIHQCHSYHEITASLVT